MLFHDHVPPPTRRTLEVIRVSQWAEIRHMHLVEGVPKKGVARRLGVNIKTVRRALKRDSAPLKRESPQRGRDLDSHRERIKEWIEKELASGVGALHRMVKFKPSMAQMVASRVDGSCRWAESSLGLMGRGRRPESSLGS